MAKRKEIKKVIFITLSNIGDVVLTLPSFDYLKERFPEAEFTVLSGPAASALFSADPRVKENIAYDKHAPFRKKARLFWRLRKEHFDVIVDLRDTVFRWLAPARFKNPYFIRVPQALHHLRLRHLYKTMAACRDKRNPETVDVRPVLPVESAVYASALDVLKQHRLSLSDPYIVVVPGARSKTKQWHKEGYGQLSQELLKHFSVIFLGDKNDAIVTKEINEQLRGRAIDLSGSTSLLEAVVIIQHAKLVIGNDSALLHFASCFDRPIVAIFGPTDERKYGPFSSQWAVVRKNTLCSPCSGDHCRRGWLCMKHISWQHVYEKACALLEGKTFLPLLPYRRLLIARTDRLGDVLLSTPVIKNARRHMPGTYIAVMVQESVAEVVKGNPYLDEVITLDKKKKHRGFFNSIRFALAIRKSNFDLALILHPSLRVHTLLFLAGIKERIGYDRKGGFLNTRKLRHTKQAGAKHEAEYALDFLRELGFDDFDRELFMPLYPQAQKWAEDFLGKAGIAGRKIIALHAQASCPSKCWPKDYFSCLVDELQKRYDAAIIYVGSVSDASIKEESSVFNLTGKTTIAQLAGILKRCDLFVSNDSGPVHMAVALGVPVISIFGRNQDGLSPRRWAPLAAGDKNVFVHKEIGCKACLAHDCERDFACLKAIPPQEILSHIKRILDSH